MATEARVRQLLGGMPAEIDRIDGTTITVECAATANDYKAVANLIRVYMNILATMPASYRLTDGKMVTEVNLHQLRMMAEDYDEKAAAGYGAFADLNIAVDDETGEDITTYVNDED